ncbi:DUF938 domain-containing protein [Methylobacterium nodulans]|uniref:SAM-dependent methyltransferase n=1 Tax=Methylobacterium nodulans (strain LMG 21967 / CNCM I-2342 / ORS 2060) TaxID=460265 RepID=B8IXD3_METNO|nr:DUF938 domain-containing protein [Methylobacterium nodulans]ACL63174.1 protein of unknown function DUF938 [Methylobacterium nodulans ORS 2060]
MLEWDAVLGQTGSSGDALFAPAVARNREVILDVLRRVLPPTGLILEVASGSGEHVVHFASALPDLQWQPSDADPKALRSIAAHAQASGVPNILSPMPLDVREERWPVARADAVLAINMVHIAPWAATEGLMAGAGRVLPEGGLLYLYGPFRVAGVHTAPSNAAFDADLRARDPAWGVRDVEAVSAAALAQGLTLLDRIPMPANNFSLVYSR